EIGLGPVRRYVRFEPTKHQYAGPAALLEISVVWIVSDRHPDVGRSEGRGDLRPSDADDGEWKSVEHERAPDHVGTCTKVRAPEIVGDDCDRLLRRDLALLGAEEPTLCERRAKHAEHVRGDERSCDPLGLVTASEVDALAAYDAKRVEASRLLFPVEIVEIHDAVLTRRAPRSPDEHQAIRLWPRQWTEQNRVDHAENRCRRADPERQCQHGDERERRSRAQRTQGEAQV